MLLDGVTLTVNGSTEAEGIPEGYELAKLELYVDKNGTLYVGMPGGDNQVRPIQVRGIATSVDTQGFGISETAVARGELVGDSSVLSSFQLKDVKKLLLEKDTMYGTKFPDNPDEGQLFFLLSANGGD